MILTDFSAIAISAIAASAFRERVTLDENIIKHIALSSFRNINKIHSKEYGDHLLLCDHRSWRKDYFPYYKANRKKDKAESTMDWELVFKIMDELRIALHEHFPFWVITEEGCEADDLIGAFAMTAQEPVVIVSNDHDFHQLIRPGVDQWSYSKKKFFRVNDPADFLIEHIIRGDSGDGIPNVLSDDNTFVTEGKRQTPLRKKKLELMKRYAENDFEEAPKDLKRNWDRNKKLIDLTTSTNPALKALDKYYDTRNEVQKMDTVNWLMKNKMVMLLSKVSDFYSHKIANKEIIRENDENNLRRFL